MPGLFCALNPGPPPPLADDPAITNKTTPMQYAAATVNFFSMLNFILLTNPSGLDFSTRILCSDAARRLRAHYTRCRAASLRERYKLAGACLIPLTRQCGQ